MGEREREIEIRSVEREREKIALAWCIFYSYSTQIYVRAYGRVEHARDRRKNWPGYGAPSDSITLETHPTSLFTSGSFNYFTCKWEVHEMLSEAIQTAAHWIFEVTGSLHANYSHALCIVKAGVITFRCSWGGIFSR